MVYTMQEAEGVVFLECVKFIHLKLRYRMFIIWANLKADFLSKTIQSTVQIQ
jgi:hypothetical protein